MYLKNVLIIAKKEFSDLLGNWMMILVIAAYFILIFIDIYNNNINSASNPVIHEIFGDNYGLYLASLMFWELAKFGSIIGVMIGCISISNERHNNALTTLLVKPLFRDTIINGKLLGAIAFMICVMGITVILGMSGTLLLYGNAVAPFFSYYTSWLMIVFIFAVIYVLFFLSLSMLISILVKNQAFALILGVITIYISETMNVYNFAWDFSALFPGDRDYVTNVILSLSPDTMIWSLYHTMFNGSLVFFDALMLIVPDIEELLLFTLIVCIISYIVFIKGDVT
jgi:ABC-2 type transport system permease protein